MKSLLKFGAILTLAILLSTDASFAQQRGMGNGKSPSATISQNISNKATVTVAYGRPGLKGRELSTLIHDRANGKVWRTGANEATAITFSTDVMFGDAEVKAGSYSLYTIPGDNEWVIILNSKFEWGTTYDETKDVVRVNAAVGEGSNLENFEIYFDTLTDNKAHMNLHWATTKVAVPIMVK